MEADDTRSFSFLFHPEGRKTWETRVLLLFLTFSALVANPKKLLDMVANPARGLLNRTKKKSGSIPPPPPRMVIT